MIRTLARGWEYVLAVINRRLDEVADPRIQLDQAIDESRRQHQALVEQASAVIATQRELEIKAARADAEIERLRSAAAQALVLAGNANRQGDSNAGERYEQSARLFATQLASTEAIAGDLSDAHDRASTAAQAARRAVEHSSHLLNARLGERARLITHIEAARLQERVADSLSSFEGLRPAASTPTFEEIRERVDSRFARAAGRAELASESIDSKVIEIERASLEEAGRVKLEEIRSTLQLPQQPGPGGA